MSDTKIILNAFATALEAAAAVLAKAAAGVVAAPAAKEEKAPAVKKQKEAPSPATSAAGKKQTPANDSLDELDSLEEPAPTNDGLDELDELDTPTTPTYTQDDVRKKLLELKKFDGDKSDRVIKVQVKFIADASKQPIVPNIPVAQYGALIDCVNGLLAKPKK